jgi:hyperosmotically inducible protein
VRHSNKLMLAAACGIALLASRSSLADRPDGWITVKVKVQLLTDEIVKGTDIDVDTIDRRVTLHGTVESSAQEERAVALTRSIEGVRDVRDLLVVVPEMREKMTRRSDRVIRQNVRSALQADPLLADDVLTVKSVNAGSVLLAGRVDSLTEHERAIRVAYSVDGVRRVGSEISSTNDAGDEVLWVQPPPPKVDEGRRSGTGVMRSDPVLTTRVKLRLLASSSVPGLDVNVDTNDGVVTLFGVVPTDDARNVAAAEARNVDGVVRVENEIQVVAAEREEAVEATDEAAQDRLESRIGAAGLDDAKVDVEVKDGVARLTGTVRDEDQRLSALIAARGTPGVKRVIDDLTYGD